VRRKQELRHILRETEVLRNNALGVLVKANRPTRHLTSRQRQIAGIGYHLGEIQMRMRGESRAVFQYGEDDAELSGPQGWQPPEQCRSRAELAQRGLLILALIDSVKKKLLQLDVLELRCRELMASIGKALEAFCHESGIIRQRMYPFGVFSRCRRTLRGFFGRAYFTFPDMEHIAALGSITGHVLKIADSPAM